MIVFGNLNAGRTPADLSDMRVADRVVSYIYIAVHQMPYIKFVTLCRVVINGYVLVFIAISAYCPFVEQCRQCRVPLVENL